MLVYMHIYKNELVALSTLELITHTLCLSVYVLSVHVPVYMRIRVYVCVRVRVYNVCNTYANMYKFTHKNTHMHAQS